MAEVFIDGELVDFTGSPPATVGDLLAVLEQAVGERGRVLAQLILDGAPFADSTAGQAVATFTRIEAMSMSADAAVAQVAGVARAAGAEAQATAEALMAAVLREPWSEAQARCVQLTSILTRMLESAISVAAHRGEESEVTAAVQEMSAVLETWVNAVQAGDAATVCLRTEDQLLPVIARIETALASTA